MSKIVGADASVRPQKNKIISNDPTSNLQRPTSNTAITLIALIITIIVLLILAGVTLNMIMGENGIIKKAQLAKDKTEEAQKEENITISEYENNINNLGAFRNNNENNSFLKIYKDDVLSEKIPEKSEGYVPVEISCTDGATANFDQENWSLNISGIKSKNMVCTIKFNYVGGTETNLNETNKKTITANGYADGCKPEYAVDGSMETGRYHNWYGGTKMLIEYNCLSLITSIGVYTTENWGYSFNNATIYYSEDDSLTLDSDLSQFKKISVDTEAKQSLDSTVKAKRVMLVKNSTEAVYEFQCFGYFGGNIK